MSTLEANTVKPISGSSTLTLGESGDTVSLGTGVTAGTGVGSDGKILISASDTTANYLQSKIVQGFGMGITLNGSGSNESITFAKADNWQYFVISANQTMSANASTTISGWSDGAITSRLIYNFGTQYVTQSSGTFSFSTEGYYRIAFRASGSTSGSTDSSGYIFTTTNNSSYGDAVDVNFSKSTGAGFNFYMDTILKVTDTTNQKVRTGIYAASNNITVAGHGGNATRQRTYIRFERLGTTA